MNRFLKVCRRLTFSIKTGNREMVVDQGNLLLETTDAIVNPANSQMSHGGGVAGAIVQTGGSIQQKMSKEWIKENGALDGLSENFLESTAFTPATGDLLSDYVIHTVGPNLQQLADVMDLELLDMTPYDDHLTNSVISAIRRAEDLGCESISFPAISSGIFRFPKKRCAAILVNAGFRYFENMEDEDSGVKLIRFIMSEPDMYEYFVDLMEIFDEFSGSVDEFYTFCLLEWL